MGQLILSKPMGDRVRGRRSLSLLTVLTSFGCASLPTDHRALQEAASTVQTMYPPVINCPATPNNQRAEDSEVLMHGGGNTIVVGTILAENAVYRNGSVLIGADGKIKDIGCDVSSDKEAVAATMLLFPTAIVSPGLIKSLRVNQAGPVGMTVSADSVLTMTEMASATKLTIV